MSGRGRLTLCAFAATLMAAGALLPLVETAGWIDRRSLADWAWLAFLAVLVMFTGFLVAVLGPLFAIACSSCQDGVRGSLRFDGAFFAVAWYAVPLTTVGTMVGMFFPRGGTRVAAIGMGALALLMVVLMTLGQYGA